MSLFVYNAHLERKIQSGPTINIQNIIDREVPDPSSVLYIFDGEQSFSIKAARNMVVGNKHWTIVYDDKVEKNEPLTSPLPINELNEATPKVSSCSISNLYRFDQRLQNVEESVKQLQLNQKQMITPIKL